jgi:N-acetyltransferase 10
LFKAETNVFLIVFLKVSLEGEISKSTIMNSLSRGKRASGDLIPWTISQQVIMERKFKQ